MNATVPGNVPGVNYQLNGNNLKVSDASFQGTVTVYLTQAMGP